MDESIYHDLPEDPELAFLHLEEVFHSDVLDTERVWGSDSPPNSIYLEYMSKTLAAAQELGLDVLDTWTPPSTSDFTHHLYLNFRSDVVGYRTAMGIRLGKRTRSFSVRLDAKAKQTIHFHINQIRQLINSTPLDDRKKERLIDKLVAFKSEVDRDRTRYESFAATVIEFAGVLGEAADRLEPARKWLDTIARLIWGAKNEEAKQLPRPAERKRIEPPKKRLPDATRSGKSLTEELDDEVPF